MAVLVIAGILWGSYVNLVGKEETVIKRDSNLDVAYQRSLDEIDGKIATMKIEPVYYNMVYLPYAQAREGYLQANKTGDTTQLDKGISEVKSAINVINVVARTESVPPVVLKAVQALSDSITNIEGIKNQERRLYNDAVQDYRQTVRTTPWAGPLGFSVDKYKPFEAQPGAERPDYKGRIEGGK